MIPHDNNYNLATLKLWEMIKIAFIRHRNIAFNRYVFFPRRQKKGETVEQFYSVLKELAEKCDFKNREEVIRRDIIITNMLVMMKCNENNFEIQWNLKEL